MNPESTTKSINTQRKPANIKTYYFPKTIKDVQTIIKKEPKIISTGSRMTYSRVDEPRTKTAFISSSRINHIHRVPSIELLPTAILKSTLPLDPVWQKRETDHLKRYFFRVGSGCKISEIRKYLEPFGFDLPHTTYSEEETIGGVVSTNSHGSSVNLPTIADCVVSIRLVTVDANFITVERKNHVTLTPDLKEDQLFNSICCGFGAFGFIYDMILLVVDKRTLFTRWIKTKWDKIVSSLPKMIEDAYQIELFIDSEKVIVKTTGETVKPNRILNPPNPYFTKSLFGQPKLISALNECAIPFKKYSEIPTIIATTVELFRDTRFYISFGKPSEIYLSPTFSTDKDVLGFIYFQAYTKDTKFENYMRRIGGVPSLSKIYGPPMITSGVKRWRNVLQIFQGFKSDFIHEIVDF